jgi:predicted PurR-regulated permease PerM
MTEVGVQAPLMEGATARSSDLTARGQATTWFVRGVGFVAGGLFTYVVATGFVGASGVVLLFFFALLLASALGPLVDRLRGSLPIGRGAAVLLVYVCFFVVVAVIGVLIIPGAVRQVADLTAALPAAIQRAKDAAQQLPAPLATNLASILDGATAALAPAKAPSASDAVAEGLLVANLVVSTAQPSTEDAGRASSTDATT